MNTKNLITLTICLLISNLRLYGMNQTPKIIRVKDGIIFQTQNHRIISAEWGNKFNLLAIASMENTNLVVQILDPISGEIRCMDAGIKSMAYLKWNPDDSILFAIGINFICAWNSSSGKLLYKIHGENVSVAFENTGSYFAVAFVNGHIIIFDTKTKNILRDFSLKINFGDSINFSPDGTFLSIYSYDRKSSSIFNVGAGEFISTITDDLRSEEYAWTSPYSYEKPDGFGKDGILSKDGKFLALIQGPNTLKKNSIKIKNLS